MDGVAVTSSSGTPHACGPETRPEDHAGGSTRSERWLGGPYETAFELYRIIQRFQPHEIFFLWRPFLRDPKDELLLELAVKARCDHIVTYNQRDFGGSETFGIAIVTPKEFLQKIGAIR